MPRSATGFATRVLTGVDVGPLLVTLLLVPRHLPVPLADDPPDQQPDEHGDDEPRRQREGDPSGPGPHG